MQSRRLLSAAIITPLADALAASLAPHARAIPLCSEDVKPLASPSDFQAVLVAGLRLARRRVLLASLYFGVEGRREQALLHELEATLRRQHNVRVTVLLDALRGTRPVSNGKGGTTSSAAALATALGPHLGGRARVFLLQSPSAAVPPWLGSSQVRELAGVSHLKAAVFDDDCVWSGANLAETYLTLRQDRYMAVSGSPALADATCEVMEAAMCGHAHELRPDGSLQPLQARMGRAASLAASMSQAVAPRLPLPASWDTLAFVGAQLGAGGLHLDERIFSFLLTSPALAGGCARVATPYCAPSPATEAALCKTPAEKLTLLTAAPAAHGFAGATGPAALVPEAYSVLQARLAARLSAARPLEVLEYARPGWQFHSKGVWVSSAPNAPVSATLIGSSNYGHRSAHRDVEASLCLVTRSASLGYRLLAEWEALVTHAHPAAPKRRPRIRAILAALVAKRFM